MKLVALTDYKIDYSRLVDAVDFLRNTTVYTLKKTLIADLAADSGQLRTMWSTPKKVLDLFQWDVGTRR